MTPRFGRVFHAFHLGLLRAASLLAPAGERVEWWREWRSELWHARQQRLPSGAGSWPAERELTAFCFGAFRDALCLRHSSPPRETRPAPQSGSPIQCLLWLAVVLCASLAAALLLPGVRAVTGAPRYRVNPGLILIERAGADDDAAASIPVEQFERWTARNQRYFDAFAFYRVAGETVSTGAQAGTRRPVAHASANLFSLLGVPLRFTAPAIETAATAPALILSCEAFVREFGGNPRIAGIVLRVGSQDARVAGVAPCGTFGLPGRVDAWLLDSDDATASASTGYVLAHLTALGRSEMTAQRTVISAYNSDDSGDELLAIAVQGQARGPWDLYLFAAFLALLALPAVTSVSMGETSFSSHRPSLGRRLVRCGFLCAKVALLLPIVWWAPLDLAYWPSTSYAVASQYVQLIAAFSMCLFGLRWAILDQRRRCPVCLRRVTNPAQVGDVSRNFLAWNGTEMICRDGHTLLHVPGLPTSWFGTQRWLYLDSSWDFLFAASGDG
jgi:hypothetical protein